MKKTSKYYGYSDYKLKQRKEDRARLSKLVAELKEASPCVDCNKSYPWYVMQYDHRQGVIKEDNVSQLVSIASKKKTLAEIDKCDLVCANCHAVRTYKRNHP